MALYIEDALSEVLGCTPLSDRRDNWLWFYLGGRGIARYDVWVMDPRTMRDVMAESITDSDITSADIARAQEYFLIPDSQLSWITDCPRQHEWIRPQIERRAGNAFSGPRNFAGRKLIVAMVDCWETDPEFKADAVASLNRQWSEQLRQDKQLDWIKEKNEAEACRYIWDWLRRHQRSYVRREREPTDHLSLLMFFDATAMTDLEKQHCISSARKLWRQDIRRNSPTGKQQYNLILSDKAIKRLDGFCKKHELSRAQIVEILLQAEQEKGLYIEERLRLLKAIEL